MEDDDFLDVALYNRRYGYDYLMTSILIADIAVAYIAVEGSNEVLYVFTKDGQAHIFQPDNIDRKMWASEDYLDHAYVIISDGKWVIDIGKWEARINSDWPDDVVYFDYDMYIGFKVHKNEDVVWRKDASTGAIMMMRP